MHSLSRLRRHLAHAQGRGGDWRLGAGRRRAEGDHDGLQLLLAHELGNLLHELGHLALAVLQRVEAPEKLEHAGPPLRGHDVLDCRLEPLGVVERGPRLGNA